MLHTFDFYEKLIGEDGEIGVLDACVVENIDHRIGNKGLIYDLADGGFDVGVAEVAVAGFEFAEAGLDGLEE